MITEQCRRNYEARIAELEAEHASALRLVSDIRFAIGDDGKRMQPELLEHATALRKDAERYAKLKPRLIAADFDYQDVNETVLVFTWPRETPVSANLDAMLDSVEAPQ